jgi:hypothetical protein
VRSAAFFLFFKKSPNADNFIIPRWNFQFLFSNTSYFYFLKTSNLRLLVILSTRNPKPVDLQPL